ncbi:MAG: glycosyltransferase [Chloroflexota bacterium]|nr:MAG: glycosyltransferase [Chloroflexota bacterium]
MHILLVGRGDIIHVQRFLQLALEAGHQVTLVDQHDPKPGGAIGYAFVPYPSRPNVGPLSRFRHMNRLTLRWTRRRLKMIWKKVCPDVVHVQYVDYRAFDCAKAGLHPLVLTLMGVEISRALVDSTDKDLRMAYIETLRRANYITADVQVELDYCQRLAGEILETGLFFYGIDLAKFKPDAQAGAALRAQLGFKSETKIVLSIRRLEPTLGQENILTAFAHAVEGLDFDASLVFLRHHSFITPPRYEQSLLELAQQLGIGHRVRWFDGVANAQMPALYNMADVVVNFPDLDGLPVSLLEAAACKRPTITCALPVYREFLAASAFLAVAPGDTSALGKTLRQVLKGQLPNLQTQLEKNHRLIAERYEQKVCFEKMEKIYQQVARTEV